MKWAETYVRDLYAQPLPERLPNAPDPTPVAHCCSCGEPIIPGDEYGIIDGEAWCEDCLEDLHFAFLDYGELRQDGEPRARRTYLMDTTVQDPGYAPNFGSTEKAYPLDGVEIPSVSRVMEPLKASSYAGISEKTLARAADKGSSVHNSIENWLKFGIDDIPEEHRPYFDGFLEWWDEYQPEVIASEVEDLPQADAIRRDDRLAGVHRRQADAD